MNFKNLLIINILTILFISIILISLYRYKSSYKEQFASKTDCAKDDTCFDSNYTCERCCSTGVAVNGAACWDASYTPSRCCSSTLSSQAAPLPGTATCAKDYTCFDSNYTCEDCCSTGVAVNGAACWDASYTPSRCCSSTLSSQAAPLPGTATCAKDYTCFDSNYTCEDCCSTGVAVNGAACWDASYTEARCCNKATPVASATSQVFPSPVAAATSQVFPTPGKKNVKGFNHITKTFNNSYNMEPGSELPISILNFKTNRISRWNGKSKTHFKDGTLKFIDFPITIKDPTFDNVTLLKGKDYCVNDYIENWWDLMGHEIGTNRDTKTTVDLLKNDFENFLDNNRLFIFIMCFKLDSSGIYKQSGHQFRFFELTKELYLKIYNREKEVLTSEKWNSFLLINKEFTLNESDELLNNLKRVNEFMYPKINNNDLFIFDYDGHGYGDGGLFGSSNILRRFHVIKWFTDLMRCRSNRRLDLLSQAGNCVEGKPNAVAVFCRFFNHIINSSTLERTASDMCRIYYPENPDPDDLNYINIEPIPKGYFSIFIHDKNKFLELYVKLNLGMKLINKNMSHKNPSECEYSQIYHYIDGQKMMDLYDNNLQEPIKSMFIKWLKTDNKKDAYGGRLDAPKEIRQAIGKLTNQLKNIVTTVSYNKPDGLNVFLERYNTDGYIP